MGHRVTLTGVPIGPGTVTGAHIPIGADAAAGPADRRTITFTTQISGMAIVPGTHTHNDDL